jgi:hypothetical protein
METNESIWLYSAAFLCVVAWLKARTGKQRIGATVVSILAAAQAGFLYFGYTTMAYAACFGGIIIGMILLESARRWEVEKQLALAEEKSHAKSPA